MNQITIKLCSRPGVDAKLFRAYNSDGKPLGVTLSSTTEPASAGARACAVKTFLKLVEPRSDRDELETRVKIRSPLSLLARSWVADLEPKSPCDMTNPAANCTWISVEIGIPDADQSVLVYAPDADEPVWLGFFDGEVWRDVNSDEYRCPVTHWMSIPEPPEEVV